MLGNHLSVEVNRTIENENIHVPHTFSPDSDVHAKNETPTGNGFTRLSKTRRYLTLPQSVVNE